MRIFHISQFTFGIDLVDVITLKVLGFEMKNEKCEMTNGK